LRKNKFNADRMVSYLKGYWAQHEDSYSISLEEEVDFEIPFNERGFIAVDADWLSGGASGEFA